MKTLALATLLATAGLCAQTTGRNWTLPTLTLKQTPRTWLLTCDYYMLDNHGGLINKRHFTANYNRTADTVKWSDVAVAAGKATLGPAEKRPFMEGFTYPYTKVKDQLKPEFFSTFPPTAMEERNLVWDTHMFEDFGQNHFEHLKLNEPYQVPGDLDAPLAGSGVFHNKDLLLTWTGITRRNGQECAVVDYRAYFNTLEVTNPGLKLIGRSHYWGQVWVSLSTKQIEYATLYEDVLGDLTVTGQPQMQINVFRIATFAPVSR